jgi:hypothetical protein
MSEYSEFAGEYIDVMRGCQAFVDIDIAPPREESIREYGSLGEVRSDLEELAVSIPRDEPDRELVEQKIGADLMYLRARDGEDIDFHEFVEGTIGITPEPIDEERVQGGIEILDMLLRDQGLNYHPGSKDEYDQKFTLENPEAIRKEFNKSMRRVRRNARGLVGAPSESFDIQYVKDEEAFWVGYLGRTASGLWMKVNLAKPQSKARIDTIMAHEYTGHALQLERWEQAIQAGDMNAALGVTAVHTAYAFQAEGVAQTAEHLMLDDSWGSIFRSFYNEYSGRVLHNAHYMINTGEDPKAAEQYVLERLPFEPADTLSAKALLDRTANPMYRAYLTAYAPSLEMLRPVRSMEPERQREVLRALYGRAMTPAQIGQLVSDDQKVAA